MTTTVVHVRDFREGRRYVLPPDVVYIGRRVPGLPASPFANPYRIGDEAPLGDFDYEPPRPRRIIDRGLALALYHGWFDDQVGYEHLDPEPLRGKRLACWCRPERCHGDVIAEWLGAHPPLAVPGAPVVFGLHVQPEANATTAPAWPPYSVVRRRYADRIRRAIR